MAKEAGFTTAEIVRIVSGGVPYSEALEIAHEYAPLLEISVKEFMELRKNEWKSNFLQPGERRHAVTLLAQFFVIDPSLLFQQTFLDRL